MAGDIKGKTPGATTMMSSELNSLANGSFAAQSTGYDNSSTLAPLGDFELVAATGSNMTANNQCELYLLPALDGTNYAGTSGPPPNCYVGSFTVQAETSGRYVLRDVSLPLSLFKAYLKNGSGQAFSASGSTLKMTPKFSQYT